MKYRNPIIPGFHPDPSLCRVGQDFYLVTSSFEYFPGVPLFHSRDLVHWRRLGHCLTRPSQLPLEKAAASGGIFAPTLRWHAGRFYMITTNVSHGGHFLVSAPDPGGPWSEPVWLEQSGIDPSLLFDDDGTVYFTTNGPGGIWQSTLSAGATRRLTEPRFLWGGTGGQFPEAPHLYKMGGRYYLMIAEGGTEYGHMVTLARSASPWGPFEACPRNPILSHRSRFSPIQATGHADLVEDGRGRWWLVCLGIRPHAYPPAHHLGRETFLAPVSWDDDGWPVVGDGGQLALEMEAELPPAQDTGAAEPVRDDFDAPALDSCWNFLRNPRPADWSLSERPGALCLRGSAVSLEDADSPAWVGRRQAHFRAGIATQVEFAPRHTGEEAGLTVRMNERHHYEVGVRFHERRRTVFVRRRIGSLQAVVAETAAGSGPVVLRVSAEPDRYRFSWSPVGETTARPLAEAETRYLATEVAGGFTGVYVAMYATGTGRPASAPAFFDWFEYRPGEERP